MSDFRTFEDISRDAYGSEAYAGLIRAANPQILPEANDAGLLGVPAGIEVFVPPLLQQQLRPRPTEPDEVTLIVGGKRVTYWETIQLTEGLGQISQVAFTVPFDPADAERRELFKPFTYKTVNVYIGDSQRFIGTMLVNPPDAEPDRVQLTINAYAKPGVLNDCTASSASFPVEFNDQKLDEIAKTLLAPFGIAVDVRDDVGAAFDRVALEADQSPLKFLIKLAQQRNLVVTSSTTGSLVFHRAITTGKAVAALEQGVPPLLSVTAEKFNEQQYYSSVTGIQPTLLGFFGGDKHTESNTQLDGVLRPLTFNAGDVEDGGLPEAVRAKMSRMFGDAVSYTATVIGWRDQSGKLWEPNTLIDVTYPLAMIYSKYRFVVSDVRFTQGPKTKGAELTLTLPGAYSGIIPEALPWG